MPFEIQVADRSTASMSVVVCPRRRVAANDEYRITYSRSTHDVEQPSIRIIIMHVDMNHARRVLPGLAAALLAGASVVGAQGATALERGFRTPPADAKPRVWWHWMNGNVTREGSRPISSG